MSADRIMNACWVGACVLASIATAYVLVALGGRLGWSVLFGAMVGGIGGEQLRERWMRRRERKT